MPQALLQLANPKHVYPSLLAKETLTARSPHLQQHCTSTLGPHQNSNRQIHAAEICQGKHVVLLSSSAQLSTRPPYPLLKYTSTVYLFETACRAIGHLSAHKTY